MKNLIFLISLFFMTVCYAAPPPDVGKATLFETDVSVLQVVAGEVFDFSVQKTEAQEVAFVDKRLLKVFACARLFFDYEHKATFAEQSVRLDPSHLIAMNKPPSYYISEADLTISKSEFVMNKQYSNYGYPFTAN